MLKQQIVNKPINSNENDQRNIYAFRAWSDEMGLTKKIAALDDEMKYKCYLQWLDSDGAFFID